MVRRTISVPPAIDDIVRRVAAKEGSYSAAVARLVEEGSKQGKTPRPSWIGSGKGPRDLGVNAEKYIRDAIRRSARRR